MSRRRDILSFQHHVTFESLTDPEQNLWLDRATHNRWSMAQLRAQLKAAAIEPADHGQKPPATPRIFGDSDSTYGYRRIAQQLARQGTVAGPELVRKIMPAVGLVACQPRPWRPSTTKQGAAGPIPDLVNRDFAAEVPGQKMVGDITYIDTWEGWAFLATVIDCATRKVIGWAVDDNYRTPLTTSAIQMAARNADLPADAVFYSDRGSNYQCRLVKYWVQDRQDWLVSASYVRWPLDREGAAFVFLDDAGIRPFAAAVTDSLEDFPDRHDPRLLESAGGKMPPAL